MLQVSRILRSVRRQPVKAVSRKFSAGALVAGKVEAFHFRPLTTHRGAILSETRAVGAPSGALVIATGPEAASPMFACAKARTLKLCIGLVKLLSRNFACATLPTPCATIE